MALHTILTPGQLAEAAGRFGLPSPDAVQPEPRGRSNTSYHLRVGADRWFLRLVEGKELAGGSTEGDLAFEAAVMGFLFQAHFPVPRLVLALDGRPWIEVAGRPAMLFAFVQHGVKQTDGGCDKDTITRLFEHVEGFFVAVLGVVDHIDTGDQ